MIDLFEALAKLAELEERDGKQGFISHIYRFNRVNEYYLHREFGPEYAGTGSQLSHYVNPWNGKQVDLQYVQVAYAIAQRAIGGPFGRIIAAGHMIAWIDFATMGKVFQGEGLKGLDEFAYSGPNYHGWVLGMEASRHDSFGDWLTTYVPVDRRGPVSWRQG